MSIYMKPAEVLAALGIHRTTLERWRREGTGPSFVKLPTGRYMYPRGAFNAWLIEHTEEVA